MTILPDSLLHSIVASLDSDNTVGILLIGSLARGGGDRHSDVDIHQYVRTMPGNKENVIYLRHQEGFLVSVHSSTLEEDAEGLVKPNRAIWVIPALRHARILLDKDGSVARLLESARDFRWSDIQPAADAMASWQLSNQAEEVYKILGALEAHDESKILFAVNNLVFDLVEMLLIQRGVLVPSENRYFDLAQETAGRDSEWTRQFRLAAALDPLPVDRPAYVQRGVATLNLYRMTAGLLAPVIRPTEADMVRRTLAAIAQAGYA